MLRATCLCHLSWAETGLGWQHVPKPLEVAPKGQHQDEGLGLGNGDIGHHSRPDSDAVTPQQVQD